MIYGIQFLLVIGKHVIKSLVIAFFKEQPLLEKKITAATYCITAVKFLSRKPDLNRRPTHYECVALPAELFRQCLFL